MEASKIQESGSSHFSSYQSSMLDMTVGNELKEILGQSLK